MKSSTRSQSPLESRDEQAFTEQLLSAKCYGVFIDDTGSPGMKNVPAKLHPERKTWVAVLVPPKRIRRVLKHMGEALNAIQSDLGLHEYHFVEIYSGKGIFRDVSMDSRLAIFQMFADFFCIHELPIYIQTLDPESHQKLMADWRVISGIDPETGTVLTKDFGRFPKIASCLDLERHDDAALWMLLTRVWDHVLSQPEANRTRAMVFVDEGLRRPGSIVDIDVLDAAVVDGRLHFASSSKMPLLQLADFAAFCLNRSQLIIRKAKRSEFEIELLRILSPIATLYMNGTHLLAWPETEGEITGTPLSARNARTNG